MQNLNKENYFNNLMEKYPKAFELFQNWVDRYKELTGWNRLFNSDSEWQDAQGKNAPSPKFHELPYELQYGVLLRFFAECGQLVFLPPGEAGDWFESIFASIERGQMKLGGLDITSPGANEIFRQRMEQLTKHGFDVDHDKSNDQEELINAAFFLLTDEDKYYPTWWTEEWKTKFSSKSRLDKIAIAGSLLAAQYDLELEAKKLNDGAAGDSK